MGSWTASGDRDRVGARGRPGDGSAGRSPSAKVLIDDFDADVAKQAASEIGGGTAAFAGDYGVRR
jgi:hypothetical protein